MTDQHFQAFFGSRTALFFDSGELTDPHVFLKFIKDKGGNHWEKPSKGEGKTVSVSLEEMISILWVLEDKKPRWETFHKFKGNTTKIEVYKEGGKVHFKVSGYWKPLMEEQAELLRLLLKHVLDEKVANATVMQPRSNDVPKKKAPAPPTKQVNEKAAKQVPSRPVKTTGKDKTKLALHITSFTPKALHVKLDGGREIWLPKSTVHSSFNEKSVEAQEILVDNWVLKRNEII